MVIGKIAGEGRDFLLLRLFLLAAVAATFTALSYVELATRIPLSGGSAAYVAEAFHLRALTALVGWGIIATGVVSAATITTGFFGYLGGVSSIGPEAGSYPPAVAVLTAVAAVGGSSSPPGSWG